MRLWATRSICNGSDMLVDRKEPMNPYQAFELESESVEGGIWFDFVDPDGNPVCRVKCRPADPELNPAVS